MLGKRFVAEQIGRLEGTEWFRALTGAGILELQRAIASAPTEIVATAIINEWLETHSERPTPADIHQAIRNHARRAETAKEGDFREVSFDSWRARGGPDDWDAFLGWLISGPVELPRFA